MFVMAFSSVNARELPDFTKLVEKNGAAVVNISTTQKIKHPQTRKPFKGEQAPEGPFGDLFRHFFGEEDGREFEDFDSKSLGSGFIISKDGYVLTNYHVIKDANEVIVRLSDRRELVADMIGKDMRSDIALLKIEADDLPVVRLGDSDKLKVGEWVLAIGSPFGFDYSVTAGIVSAKGRSLPRENYVPFIQTDVAINPGNSGGPLFNLDGKVIGINSQIYSRTGGFMGLSFAIPINMVMNVVEQLKGSGHVARGWLGVLIQDVTRELAEGFGMKKPRGALVAKVLPDSPAEKSGFQVGDVVVEFDGKKIVRSSNLPPVVGLSPVGKDVNVKILRKGNVKTLKVRLGELPDDGAKVAMAENPKVSEDSRINVVVTDLTAELRKKLDIKDNGVVVKSVTSGPARRAGVRRGDVILMINNTDVKDTIQFKEIIDGLPVGKSVPLLVQRRGGPVFLALKLVKEDDS
ncbi:MAG: DegQ family serine endoprotease [Gammaproteobacteria bacterium]|nr:DegQ family serine endoprotease [Gammaproteobacteria bacterium]